MCGRSGGAASVCVRGWGLSERVGRGCLCLRVCVCATERLRAGSADRVLTSRAGGHTSI